jgi:hypothetical protein
VHWGIQEQFSGFPSLSSGWCYRYGGYEVLTEVVVNISLFHDSSFKVNRHLWEERCLEDLLGVCFLLISCLVYSPLSCSRPLLWSSGQSSWLQIQRSGFDSRNYQIFWEVVGLERGPLNLVNITEELLGRKSSGSDLEIREYGSVDPLLWLHDIPLTAKFGTKFVDKRRSLGPYSSLAD